MRTRRLLLAPVVAGSAFSTNPKASKEIVGWLARDHADHWFVRLQYHDDQNSPYFGTGTLEMQSTTPRGVEWAGAKTSLVVDEAGEVKLPWSQSFNRRSRTAVTTLHATHPVTKGATDEAASAEINFAGDNVFFPVTGGDGQQTMRSVKPVTYQRFDDEVAKDQQSPQRVGAVVAEDPFRGWPVREVASTRKPALVTSVVERGSSSANKAWELVFMNSDREESLAGIRAEMWGSGGKSGTPLDRTCDIRSCRQY